MNIFKASAGHLADYINFLLTFLRSPKEAMASKMATSEGVKPAVSTKLVMYSLLSVGAAIVIVQIGAAVGMAEEQSISVVLLRRLDEKVLPVAVLVAILALSAIVHLVLRAVALLDVLLGNEPFRGSIEGSVNAALGFAALSIPIMTTAVVSLRVAAAQEVLLNPIVSFLVSVPLSLALWVYLTAAFAAAHRITILRSNSLFGLTIAVIILLRELI